MIVEINYHLLYFCNLFLCFYEYDGNFTANSFYYYHPNF